MCEFYSCPPYVLSLQRNEKQSYAKKHTRSLSNILQKLCNFVFLKRT